jgi:hypothetical protein
VNHPVVHPEEQGPASPNEEHRPQQQFHQR